MVDLIHLAAGSASDTEGNEIQLRGSGGGWTFKYHTFWAVVLNVTNWFGAAISKSREERITEIVKEEQQSPQVTAIQTRVHLSENLALLKILHPLNVLTSHQIFYIAQVVQILVLSKRPSSLMIVFIRNVEAERWFRHPELVKNAP